MAPVIREIMQADADEIQAYCAKHPNMRISVGEDKSWCVVMSDH